MIRRLSLFSFGTCAQSIVRLFKKTLFYRKIIIFYILLFSFSILINSVVYVYILTSLLPLIIYNKWHSSPCKKSAMAIIPKMYLILIKRNNSIHGHLVEASF